MSALKILEDSFQKNAESSVAATLWKTHFDLNNIILCKCMQ